jgi:hypothetical protein
VAGRRLVGGHGPEIRRIWRWGGSSGGAALAVVAAMIASVAISAAGGKARQRRLRPCRPAGRTRRAGFTMRHLSRRGSHGKCCSGRSSAPVWSGWPAPARSHGEVSRRSFSKRNDTFGSETSARSSEVIHAGLYYPSGSLKAALCVAGRRQLYDFCSTHGVSHRRCGKLIVATSAAQEGKQLALQQQGQLNGVDDLRLLSAAEARALEPELACTAALLSPSTGIIDSHGLMLALLGDAERDGASLALALSAATWLDRTGRLHPRKRRRRKPALADGDADQRRRSLGPGSRRLARRLSGRPDTGRLITPRATTTRSPVARLSRGWSIRCLKRAAWACT